MYPMLVVFPEILAGECGTPVAGDHTGSRRDLPVAAIAAAER
jgi:hypothetical protein